MGYSPWGCCKESDSTDATEHTALLLEEESGALPFKGIRDSNYILNKLSTTPSFFFFNIVTFTSAPPPLKVEPFEVSAIQIWLRINFP